MAVTITKQSGDLVQTIDTNFNIVFSATTDTPIYDTSDPPVQTGTATMVSLTTSVSYNETDPVTQQQRVSAGSGTSSATVSGEYTQDTFPQCSMTYIPRGSNTNESTPTTITNFDLDNVPVNPNTIELLAMAGASSNIKNVTITVTGTDSEDESTTETYTLRVENNLNKIKTYIKRVYP